jgi:transposase
VNDIEREKIVTAFRQNQDWQALAEQLGVKRQTARNIVINWRRHGRIQALPRGGNRQPSLTGEQVDAIVTWIEGQPSITLSEIRQRLMLRDVNWPACTVQTISRAIDGSFISLKKLHAIPTGMQTQQSRGNASSPNGC